MKWNSPRGEICNNRGPWRCGGEIKLYKYYKNRFIKNTSLPSNIQKALTTTAKGLGLLNQYGKDAVCDSGATHHFVPESFQGVEEDTTRKGLEVGCANIQIIESVSTDTLNFTKPNKGSNTCHKFKDKDMENPLLSIPQLAKNGNDILMTEGKVLVIDREKEELVLDGTMDPNWGLYLVPLYHYAKENRALTVSPMNTAQRTLKTAQLSNIVPQPQERALSANEYEVKANAEFDQIPACSCWISCDKNLVEGNREKLLYRTAILKYCDLIEILKTPPARPARTQDMIASHSNLSVVISLTSVTPSHPLSLSALSAALAHTTRRISGITSLLAQITHTHNYW
jgi:hypothetical protein